ncbi:hypothetical protein CYY_001995 [Polysphondylium violaceum]|uniref:Cation efflux protein transmembrane domain-containing protein n=1 Tax=Polysphondylium violaceum TaxID=133409 RepID=A0A8J4V7B5_9MYCE|nr:hypothetical protein CYY_001995 [Polysphondylium violaceum]
MKDNYDPYSHDHDNQNQYQQPQYNVVGGSPSTGTTIVSPQSISSPVYDYNINSSTNQYNNHGHSHNSNSGGGGHHHHNRLGHPQPYYASYNDINSKPQDNNSNNNYNNYSNYYTQQQQQQQQQYNNNYDNNNYNNNNNYYPQQQQQFSPQQFYNNNLNGGNVSFQLLLNNLLNDNDAKKLAIWIVVMLIFTLYEIFYGAYLESLGLVSDGFHTLFDCIGLIISLMGMIFGRKGPNQDYTYGYDRWEVLGTFANCCFLLFVSFFLFLESIERLLEPPHIHDHGRVISLAFVSLIINLLGLFFFKRQHSPMDSNNNRNKGLIRNMNLLTITNHILVDSCTSLGVIFSSLLGKTMGLEISDSLISLIIAAIIVYDVLPVALRTAKTLLQTTPDAIKQDIDSAMIKIQKINGVLDCNERHFWAHSSGSYIGSINVIVRSNCLEHEITSTVRKHLSFIQDLTVQVEREHIHNHNHQHSHNQEQLNHEHKHHHNHDNHDHHNEHNHDHHDHDHHEHHDEHNHDEHDHHGHSHNNNNNNHGHSHNNNNNHHGHSHNNNNDQQQEHHHSHDQEDEVPKYQVQQEDTDEIEHEHEHEHDHEHIHDHHHNENDDDHNHSHGHSHQHKHNHSHDNDHHNHNHSHNTDGWGEDDDSTQ